MKRSCPGLTLIRTSADAKNLDKVRPCSGLTLIELLVVASIMAILFALGVASYSRFNRNQTLEQASLELKNNLRLAQSRSSSGEKPSLGCDFLWGYQVTFFANPAPAKDSYVIQAKCSSGLAGSQQTFNLPATVRFQAVPPTMLFKVLAGGVIGAGPISLSAFGTTKTITVTNTGEIR